LDGRSAVTRTTGQTTAWKRRPKPLTAEQTEQLAAARSTAAEVVEERDILVKHELSLRRAVEVAESMWMLTVDELRDALMEAEAYRVRTATKYPAGHGRNLHDAVLIDALLRDGWSESAIAWELVDWDAPALKAPGDPDNPAHRDRYMSKRLAEYKKAYNRVKRIITLSDEQIETRALATLIVSDWRDPPDVH
jgi:hypothetical protein